jgi:hypothetical protein
MQSSPHTLSLIILAPPLHAHSGAWLLGRIGVDEWWLILGESGGGGGAHLFLDNEDLRSDCLDLGHDLGVDELLEADTAEVVEQAEVELVQAEVGEVEGAEHTRLGEQEEVLELLELEQRLEVELVAAEQAREAIEVQVVELTELGEELEVKAVDVEQVVEVGLGELQVVELAEVEAVAALLSRGRSDQGGQGRDKDGGGLHFCWCWSNDSRRFKELKN